MFAPVPFFGRGGDPPPLRVRLVHKRAAWDVVVDARATFGELRYEAKTLTGLPMDAFKLLYRGREKADGDPLLLAGIKDGAMVQVVETLAYQDQIRNAAAGMQRAQQASPASPLPQPPHSQQPGGLHTLPNGAPTAAGPSPAQQQSWNPTFPAASAAAGAGAPPHPQPMQQPRPQQGATQQQGRPREDSSAGGRFDPPFPPPKRAEPPQQGQHPPLQQPAAGPQPLPGATAQPPQQQQQQPQQQQAQQRRGPIGPQPQPQQEAAADPAAALEAQLMGRIAAVQQELDGLTQQVDALTADGGAPAAADPARHQRAVLLLELLTRVMLTLDGIRAPDGGETPPNVRAARKAGVVRAQQLVDRVEDCKAAA